MLTGLSASVAKVADEKGVADPGTLIDEVRFSFDAAPLKDVAKVKCIWVALKYPGEADFPGFASYLLVPEEKSLVHIPEGIGDEMCYRFAVIAEDRRGEPADRCVKITSSRPLVVASDNRPADGIPGPPATGDSGASGGGGSSFNPWWIAPGVAAALAIAGVAGVRRRRARS